MVTTIGTSKRPNLRELSISYHHIRWLISSGREMLLSNVVLKKPMPVLSIWSVRLISSLKSKDLWGSIKSIRLSISIKISTISCPKSKIAIRKNCRKLLLKKQSGIISPKILWNNSAFRGNLNSLHLLKDSEKKRLAKIYKATQIQEERWLS